MRRILNTIASILICITIYAIVATINEWLIGSDNLMGAFNSAFLMTLIFGSWLF